MLLDFNYISEDTPSTKWLKWFNHFWPAYRAWFLSQGESARPTYRDVMRQLNQHMPELVPNLEQMTELAGGGDHTARFLGQYCPPPFFASCSQAILTNNEPVLIRNYDYSPRLFDALAMKSKWNETTVIGMADCMTGLVDGMNDSGLVISLAFGGSREVGTGFGIGLIQRYVLETCHTVQQAVDTLKQLPAQIAYNLALLDHDGNHATIMMSPNSDPVVTQEFVSTNHQENNQWQQYLDLIKSEERFQFLKETVDRQIIDATQLADAFLSKPLYRNSFEMGYGTLYTAAYYPLRKEVHFLWPDDSRICQLNSGSESDDDWRKTIRYGDFDMDSTSAWPPVYHATPSLPQGFINY